MGKRGPKARDFASLVGFVETTDACWEWEGGRFARMARFQMVPLPPQRSQT